MPLRVTRSETEPNGSGNVSEFGSSKTADGFAQLHAMDAYVHIVDGRRYPAVLGITGINDPRVAPWQVARFVARLRHASSSGRPVLMRVDYDAGHGIMAASRNQAVALFRRLRPCVQRLATRCRHVRADV